MDFYLWFRYKGNLNPDQIEFSNYGIDRLDSGERLAIEEPIQRGKTMELSIKYIELKPIFTKSLIFAITPLINSI